jgi:hypothetical protein
MKPLHLFPGVALCAATVLLSACAATQSNKPRFHEEASSDVIIDFPGWSAISISKPNTSEGLFTSLFTRNELEARLAKLPVPHNMAVIACELNYTEEERAEQQQAWGAIFKKLGFQRVVFVTGQRGHTVNGSYVVKDMILTDKPASEAVGASL